jgi:hypothetical protein
VPEDDVGLAGKSATMPPASSLLEEIFRSTGELLYSTKVLKPCSSIAISPSTVSKCGVKLAQS